MAKVATKYLKVHPWKITEKGFHKNRSQVSESIFSVGNEYMGVRGYFEEGYSGDTMLGSYFNGVFENRPIYHAATFKGMSTRLHFMINACDWLHTRIMLDGETLDLATASIAEFERELDLRTGLMTRSFVWKTKKRKKKVRLALKRFTSMTDAHLGAQRIECTALNFTGQITIRLGVDFGTLHGGVAFGPESDVEAECFWQERKKGTSGAVTACLGETLSSQQKIFSGFRILSDESAREKTVKADKLIGREVALRLRKNKTTTVDRLAWNVVDKRPRTTVNALWKRGMSEIKRGSKMTFDTAFQRHVKYWENVWNTLDVEIEGDPANQQGVRYCIFQMHQTYHGVDPTLNVGAKGLTGEAYCGHAFWDSETYCLPFYLFNNPDAAKNLLLYRYHTLPEAKERARELDCEGARYPMCTIDGTEACGVWQHGDLEIHVPAAVAYGIWHYTNVTGDTEFLYNEGAEMLVELSRYFASRGQWSPITGEYGFWGVMGADEFHMMVHNNAYTNVMAKKCFEWTVKTLKEMGKKAPRELTRLKRKLKLKPAESRDWAKKARKMRTLHDKKSGLIEQHDGYFDLPHIDCDSIPPTEFPLYHHWAYVRIFRYDMIKQPDALLLPFFFSQEYSDKQKRVNFDYYEPRCIHESSLSPGIHAILASELGRHKMAYDYSAHASRLDLDDYNRNTKEGLHTTSMAASWMLMVYGFGGLRSDGKTLSLNPSIPAKWKSYSFRILYRDSVLLVKVAKKTATLSVVDGKAVRVKLFGKTVSVPKAGIEISLPANRVGRK